MLPPQTLFMAQFHWPRTSPVPVLIGIISSHCLHDFQSRYDFALALWGNCNSKKLCTLPNCKTWALLFRKFPQYYLAWSCHTPLFLCLRRDRRHCSWIQLCPLWFSKHVLSPQNVPGPEPRAQEYRMIGAVSVTAWVPWRARMPVCITIVRHISVPQVSGQSLPDTWTAAGTVFWWGSLQLCGGSSGWMLRGKLSGAPKSGEDFRSETGKGDSRPVVTQNLQRQATWEWQVAWLCWSADREAWVLLGAQVSAPHFPPCNWRSKELGNSRGDRAWSWKVLHWGQSCKFYEWPFALELHAAFQTPKRKGEYKVTFSWRGKEFQLGFHEEAKANAVKNVSGLQIQAPSPRGPCSRCVGRGTGGKERPC